MNEHKITRSIAELALQINGEYQLSIWKKKNKDLDLYLRLNTKIDSR